MKERRRIIKKTTLRERLINLPFEMQLRALETWREWAMPLPYAGQIFNALYLFAKTLLGHVFTDSDLDFIEYSPLVSSVPHLSREPSFLDNVRSRISQARFIEFSVITVSIANTIYLFLSKKQVSLFHHPTEPNPLNPNDHTWNLKRKSKNVRIVEIDVAQTDASLIPSDDGSDSDGGIPAFAHTPTPLKNTSAKSPTQMLTPLTNRFRDSMASWTPWSSAAKAKKKGGVLKLPSRQKIELHWVLD
ncbi:hypothetical protein HK100_010526, partial [Physocladia obscura]